MKLVYLVKARIVLDYKVTYQVVKLIKSNSVFIDKETNIEYEYFTVVTTSELKQVKFSSLNEELLYQAIKLEKEIKNGLWPSYTYVSILPNIVIDLLGYKFPEFPNRFMHNLKVRMPKPIANGINNKEVHSPQSTIRTLDIKCLSSVEYLKETGTGILLK